VEGVLKSHRGDDQSSLDALFENNRAWSAPSTYVKVVERSPI
jgi:hypothetical protein